MVWGTPATAPPAAPGAWADDEPEEEDKAALNNAPSVDPNLFPSLGEAVKQQQPKKKKGQKLHLGEFLAAPARTTVGYRGPSDQEILASLPTAPRADRGDDGGADTGTGLGGGFKEYGGNRGGGGFRRDGEMDRDRPDRRDRDDYPSSRADEVRDWGATRTFQPSDGPRGGGFGGPGGERRGGGGFGSDRPLGAADNVDDWGTTKKFEPRAEQSGGFRDGPSRPGGFREGPPRGGGFEPSRADEGEWGNKAFTPSDPPVRSNGGGRFGFADRPGGGGSAQAADEEERWARRGPPEPAPASSSAAPAERPRLNLKPRSVPVNPSEGGGSQDEPKKLSSNPFGGARPREEILKEKGIDVKDEPPPKSSVLEAVVRDEAPEEKAVKDEIEALRKKLEMVKASGPDPESIADDVASAAEDVEAKIQELAKLKLDLDQKVRDARKAAAAGPAAAKQQEAEDGGAEFHEARPAYNRGDQKDREPLESKEHKGGREPRERKDPREPRGERAAGAPSPSGRGRGGPAAAPGAPGRERAW